VTAPDPDLATPAVPAHRRRAERGHFLRTRRERLLPSDVGLPEEPGRRTRGLRREEVAALAHVSVAWYTFLEQGRSFRPSPEVLDALSVALRLDLAERQYLHALSQETQGPVPVAADHGAPAVARSLVALNDDGPFPVYALDVHGTVVAVNAAVADWYGDLGAEGNPNFVRWLFTAPEARRRLHDWEGEVRHLTAQIRFHTGVSGGDPRTRALVDELLVSSPEFRRRWEEHDVATGTSRLRVFDHPERGVVTLRLVVVRPTDDPSTVVTYHLPHDTGASDEPGSGATRPDN
jgi:transcriptional regulator with XRE-family HTH domain